jgi:amino acid transporter
LVAVSRLVFAVARDGVFPYSDVLSRVSKSKQPHNAVIFIATIAALLLCTQLPSQVAFSSLISTSAAGSIAAYGLVGIGRAFITRKTFRPGFWDLGRFGVVAAVVTFIWNGFAFAVLCAPTYSNSAIDEDSSLFNYAIVIMGGVTILAIAEWWRKSNDDWFKHLKIADSDTEVNEPIGSDENNNAPVSV